MFLELANSLLSGKTTSVDSLLQLAGRNAIMSLLGGPSSPLGIIFDELLKGSRPNIRGVVREGIRDKIRRRRYSQAHAEWLNDNRWRFDWRSQPRQPRGTPEGGEWMPGRLDYPVSRKNPVSRSQMRRRLRAMRAYKLRMKAAGYTPGRKGIMSSWNNTPWQ